MLSKLKTITGLFSSIERRYLFFFSLLALISGLTLIIIVFNRSTKLVPVAGGVWHEGLVGQPIFINPILSGNNDVDRDLIALTFCNLYDIADKIEPDESRLNWRVRLKDNVTWHDLRPLTSDDIIFTINQIQNSEFKSPLSATWQGVNAERVSELELLLTIPAPFAFFEDNLKKLYPVPKHIFADIPLNNWRLSDYNLEPLGCGPFKFDSYQKRSDGFITKYFLIANPDYFSGRPYLDRFEISFYTETSKAIEDFIFAKINGLGNLSKHEVDLIKRRHLLHVLPTSRYFAVFINQNTHPALKDKNVRLALSTAIDRDFLIKETLGGYATPITGPVTPNFLSDQRLYLPETVPDSAVAARAILDNSNWLLDETNGLRLKSNQPDLSLEFDLIVPETPLLTKTAELLKNSWQASGIKINLITLSPDTVNNEVIKERNYQLLLFGNILGANPDLFSFWHSSEKLSPGLNLSLYDRPAADKLIESIRQNFNASERQSDLVSLQTMITLDQPAVFLHSPSFLYLTTPDLKGFGPKLVITPADRFSDVSSWYLKTARQFK